MTFKLLDVVRATEDVPAFAVKAGDVGTVVEVYEDGDYEVEFCDKDGRTLATLAMTDRQLRSEIQRLQAA